MKRLLLLIVISFLYGVTSIVAQFEIKLNEELFVSKISDKIFIITHYFPWESNSLVVLASKDEVVLVDTPYEPKATKVLLNWVKSNFNPKKVTAINTGFHVDNLGGNKALIENGITVYGSNQTINMIKEQARDALSGLLGLLKTTEYIKYYNEFKGMEIVAPNVVFDINQGLNIIIGDFTFDIFFPGETYSPDNVVVYIKEKNILFAGCMVRSTSNEELAFLSEGGEKGWKSSLQTLLKRYKDAKLVIPHHGQWGDLELIKHTINLF